MDIAAVSSNLAFEEALSNFSFSLFATLEKHENAFISPFSISAALLMLSLGTNGKTKTELETGIFGNHNVDGIHSRYKTLYTEIFGSTDNGISLSLANRLFVNTSLNLLDTFTTQAFQNYNSEAQRLNFYAQTEPSRHVINEWIANQTNNKIQHMIPTGVLERDTLLLIANAIYFKGTWKTKFKSRGTSRRFFYNSKSATPVDMMFGKFRVKSGENYEFHCKVLQLPYIGDKLSMVILLPQFWNGLSALESQLSYKTLQSILGGIQKQETIIRIPKFSFKSDNKLKDLLRTLGINDIFHEDGSANFTRMFTLEQQIKFRPCIRDILHKAFIEINEHGSEAAASNAIMMGTGTGSFMEIAPFEFVAEHPFMYLIIDDMSQTILFMGRYVDP